MKLSTYKIRKIKKFLAAKERLIKLLEREPMLEEIAADLDVDIDEIRKLVKFKNKFIKNEVIKKEFKKYKENLEPRECEILEMRFGIIDGIKYTLKEIGQEFNVDGERIRQIETKVLKKLNYNMHKKGGE